MAHSASGGYFGQSAPKGMDNTGEDSRVLAAVFQDIIPVLTRIQTRSPQANQAASFGQISVESAAAVALVSDLGADSLRRLTMYLDVNAGRFEGLENCAPIVAAAARALAGRDYAQTFTLIFDVYRTIALLRAEDQRLPLPGSIKNVSMDERRSEESRRADGDNQEGSSAPPH